jgi:hypothetical protein
MSMTASLRVSDTPLNLINAKPVPIEPGVTIHELFLRQSENYSEPVNHVACFIGTEQIDPDLWKTRVIMEGDSVVVCPVVHGVDPFTILIIAVVAIAAISMMSVPVIDQPGETPKPSDSYDVSAQGNRAKLGDPIPTRYGRFRVFPDYAATPYREFENDDQFLYQLFSIGHGEYDYADLKIGDTPIGNFSDVDSEFYSPGQAVTLFRDTVNVSPDVTDSELKAPNDGGDWVGPFVANDPDTTVEELAIDVVFPQGLHLANDEGGLSSLTVDLEFQYREIDDIGDPVGLWTALTAPSYTSATVDAIRRTVKVDVSVTSGRVEVRGRRTDDTVDNFRYRDEAHWTGLKAYLESSNVYSHSTWAVKVKATDQISSQNDRKFNLVATRKLAVWNGTSWDAIAATRNPAWAFCDAIKAEYGGGYGDSSLNLAEIKAVADEWDTRGDFFDGQFDRKGTLWSRLLQICLVGRAYPYQYGETFTILRDGVNGGASYLFNGRNVIADSMQITYQTADEFADDSVEIEYTDPTTWQKETILAAVPGSPAGSPKKIKWPFVTSRIQAHREAMFMAAKQEFRNVHATFRTELDGRVLDYLTPIMVVHDLPRWGGGGEILAVSGNTLTLSEPVVFDGAGDHHIYFRDDTGQLSSPFVVTAGANEYEVIAAGTLPTIYVGEAKTRTFFAFSSSVSSPRQMLVEKVQAKGEYETIVGAVVDDPIVHSYDALIDDGTIATPDPEPPNPVDQFKISNLVAIQGGTLTSPELQLSWSPAHDAQRYLVDISFDAGVSWTRAATVLNNNAIIAVRFGVVDVRIAPQNDAIGLWFQLQVDVGTDYAVPPTPTGLSLSSAFTGIQVIVDWDTHVNAVAWVVEVVDLAASVRHTETVTSNSFSYSHAQALLQGVGREFDIEVTAVNANGVSSVAPAVLRVKNAQSVAVTGLTATGVVDQVILTWNAVTEPDNVAYRVYGSNVESPGGGQPLIDGNVTALTFAHKVPVGEDWWFTVAAVDAWGTDEINLATQVTATTSKIIATQISDDAIETPHLGANVVTAAKMLVTQLSAITANLGTVTAGLLKTTTGTGARAELDSAGNYPFWIGNGAKGSANGEAYYDKTTQTVTFHDPTSGMKFELQAGAALPFWYGAGNKTEGNAKLFIDSSGNIVAKGLEIRDPSDNVVFSSGGTYSGGYAYENLTGLPNPSRSFGNLLDVTQWVIGTTGTQGDFTHNGKEEENEIFLEEGPYGETQPVWVCEATGDDNADGGWVNDVYPVNGYDHTKTYRFSVWIWQEDNDSNVYLGAGTSDKTRNLSDSSINSNPYFYSGDLPSLGKWFLVVGILHGSGYSLTAQSGISGAYDPLTGLNVDPGTDYKSEVGALFQTHRAYHFYASVAGLKVKFANPRMDLVDGTEPTLISMMSGAALLTDFTDNRIANNTIEDGVVVLNSPGGARYSANAVAVGAIVVTLPQSWSNDMMKFDVDVFDYAIGGSFTAKVAGYNYAGTSAWLRYSAQIIGNIAGDNRVRLGHDGTNCVVVIGETGTNWEYPVIAVKNFQLGYANADLDEWKDGWSINVVDDLTGYTFTADFADALLDAKSISGQGALATQDDVNYTAVTGPKPPTDADNTASNTSAMAHIDQITSGNISTFIASAAIGNAYIGNAAVNTLKLAGESVVITESSYVGGNVTVTTSWTTVGIKSIVLTDVLSTTAVLIVFKCSVFLSDDSTVNIGNVNFRILRNGSQVHTEVARMSGQGSAAAGVAVVAYPNFPGSNGTHTYTIQANCNFAYNGTFSSRALSLTGSKR